MTFIAHVLDCAFPAEELYDEEAPPTEAIGFAMDTRLVGFNLGTSRSSDVA